jgi:amidophosphoribosyltransferase
LIAAQLSVEEIRDHIGADSLGYLSLEGMLDAIGLERGTTCQACWTGTYPTLIANSQAA